MGFDERIIPSQSPQWVYKEHIARYEFASKNVKNKGVLDIACGAGYGSEYLLRNGKANFVIGVDLSEEAIRYAKEHFKSVNLEFLVGDAANLDFQDNFFDVVVSFETIEHINEYHKYLKEMYRVLKPNSWFIISTPNKRFYSPKCDNPLNPYHVIEFRLNKFQEILRQGKFKIVAIYGQDHQDLTKKLKQKIVSMIPKKIRHALISEKIRDTYNTGQLSGMTNEDVENCLNFICVCKK